jgi:YggT family protein
MTTIIILLFGVYKLLIVARVITSWVRVDPGHPLMDLLMQWTEPVLDPVRRLVGGDRMMFDFSPFVVLLALEFIEKLIMRVLF